MALISNFIALFQKSGSSEAAILNRGLRYTMAFGKNWMQPIQSRLSDKFPELTSLELDEYDTRCREALNFGLDLVYDRLSGLCDNRETVQMKVLRKDFEDATREMLPWISRSNQKALLKQALYYSWHDGVDACIQK